MSHRGGLSFAEPFCSKLVNMHVSCVMNKDDYLLVGTGHALSICMLLGGHVFFSRESVADVSQPLHRQAALQSRMSMHKHSCWPALNAPTKCAQVHAMPAK